MLNADVPLHSAAPPREPLRAFAAPAIVISFALSAGRTGQDAPPLRPDSVPGPSSTAPHPQPSDAVWTREPIVAAALRHSLPERVWLRTGGRSDDPTINEREAEARERSDALLATLKSLGVNTLIIPYGGAGPAEVEAPERAIAVEHARRAQRAGFRVIMQLPSGRLNPKQWPASQPVDDWLVRTADGRAVASPYPGWFHASLGAAENRAFVDQMVASLLNAFRPDAVLISDPTVAVGVEGKATAAFTAQRQGEVATSSVVSADSAGASRLPTWSPAGRSLDEVNAWVRFRAGVLTDFLASLHGRLAAASPPIGLGIELPLRLTRPSPSVGTCFDARAVLRLVQLAWDPAGVRIEGNGLVRHQVPNIKAAVSAGIQPIVGGMLPVEVAQSMAFGRDAAGCIAFFSFGHVTADSAGMVPVDPVTARLVRFLHERRRFYAGAEHLADVVLARPAMLDARPLSTEQASYVQTESALVTHNLAFGVTLDEAFAPLRPDQTLVLAGVSELAPDQVARVEAHLHSGGGVVAIVPKDGFALSAQLDQIAARLGTRPADAPPDAALAANTRCIHAGNGRLAILSRPGPPQNVWLTTAPATHRPANVPPRARDEFAAVLAWAIGRPLQVQCPLTGAAAMELTRSKDGNLTLLHVVNFNRQSPHEPVEAQVLRPPGATAQRVMRYAPSDGAEGSVDFRVEGAYVTFTTSPVTLYDVYCVEWKRGNP